MSNDLRARIRAALDDCRTLTPDAQTDAVMAVLDATRTKTPKTPPAPPTVGEAIARTLKSLGMTQIMLARITGLTAKHVNQVITGKVGLSPDVAVKFAHATGTPAAVWLGIDGARHEWEARLAECDETPGADAL